LIHGARQMAKIFTAFKPGMAPAKLADASNFGAEAEGSCRTT
jgi:hypothetical protein